MKSSAAYRLQIEHEERKTPFLRDAAVELAQRACRAVPWVGEELQSQKLPSFIDRLECFLRHIDFASNLEVRQRFLELVHNVFDDLGIFRDILALHETVAPRDGMGQHTVFVAQGKRKAVDFFLDDEFRTVHTLLHITHECLDLFAREHVLQGKHRHIVTQECARCALCRTANLLRR